MTGSGVKSVGFTKHTHAHTHTHVHWLALLNKERCRAGMGGTLRSRRDLSKVSQLKVMDGRSWTGILFPGALGTFVETRKTIKIFGDTGTK